VMEIFRHIFGRNASYLVITVIDTIGFFFSSSLLPHVGACSRFGA
jgi:hypothetical protein